MAETSDYTAAPLANKETLEWGTQQAERLWANTFRSWDVDWRNARTFDFGCHWGYFLKYQLEYLGTKSGVGVDIYPLWEQVADWEPTDTPNLHLHVGDVLKIAAIQNEEFDIVTCAGTLMLLPPTDAYNVVQWFYDHLRAGGDAVIRVRAFTSYCGGDYHRKLKTKLPHLLFAKRTIDQYLRETDRELSRYMSPLTASSYLMMFQRVGFEIIDVRRTYNPTDLQPIYENLPEKLTAIDFEELRTNEIIVHLRKPDQRPDFAPLEAGA